MLLSLTFTICLTVVSCKAPPPGVSNILQPMIRVGIVEQRQRVDFKIPDGASFQDKNGSPLVRSAKGGHWQVEVLNSQPARFEYRLSVGTPRDRYSAEEIVRYMDKRGLDAEIRKQKIEPEPRLGYAHKAVYHVLLKEKFQTEKQAKSHMAAIHDKTNSDVVAIPISAARGAMRFRNLDTGDSFDARDVVKLEATEVELAGVDVGSGFHWESSERRRYGGAIEFVVDASGGITVVNRLLLESYLRGVVPSEMPASFPHEALKAQAVTARVEAISKLGRRHPFEPFDLCDDVHCQVFSGISKLAAETDRAIQSTRGTFMVYRNQLSEAFYAGVCGGHTENNDNVWNMNATPYLRGVLDKHATRLRSALADETKLRRWIDNSPDVYCNPAKGNVPKSVSYSKKYFRWQFRYSREELERIIKDKTGEEFGHLQDLKPVSRGVSGRLIELEVVGTKRSFRISKELAIRRALSRNTLYSACFYVAKEGETNALPRTFVLRGGGWGHGVGMCQVGAAVMAHRGKRVDQILRHYYRGVFLEKLYK